MLSKYRLLIICLALFILFNFLTEFVWAGWWTPGSPGQQYLEKIGETGFGATGPPQGGVLQRTIFKIINYVLGFLGIVFMILIIYGGFVWMTSAGNDQRVTQAKKIIGNAAIGLAIVLISYGVTLLIFRTLIEGTGGG